MRKAAIDMLLTQVVITLVLFIFGEMFGFEDAVLMGVGMMAGYIQYHSRRKH